MSEVLGTHAAMTQVTDKSPGIPCGGIIAVVTLDARFPAVKTILCKKCGTRISFELEK